MDYRSFCKQFTDDVPDALLVGERYYLRHEEVSAFRSGEQRKPHAQGLCLGMGKQFVPSLALLAMLTPNSSRIARVTSDRAEWLFVCGRDMFAENFETAFEEGYVLVVNSHGENLGLGKLMQGKDGLLLKNVLDRGNYLRHEKVVL